MVTDLRGARELGIGFVPTRHSAGFLTGAIRLTNFDHNLVIADTFTTIAAWAGATPAKVAIAWPLT